MVIKAGIIFPDNGNPTDAEWEYSEGSRVLITQNGFVIASIDPDDFLAIADAIRGNIMFNQKLKHGNNNRAAR